MHSHAGAWERETMDLINQIPTLQSINQSYNQKKPIWVTDPEMTDSIWDIIPA